MLVLKRAHSGSGEQWWYLFPSKAVEGQLFLYSIASVDHQAGVCGRERSETGRWSITL